MRIARSGRFDAWRLAAAACLGLVTGDFAVCQSLGEAPVLGLGARDLAAVYPLPRLHDGPGEELASQVGNLQVGKRARSLGLGAHSALAAWTGADALLARAEKSLAAGSPVHARRFNGTRSSELNAILRDPRVAAVEVRSARLNIDETIVLSRPGLWLGLGHAELRAVGPGPRFLVRVERTSDVTVKGGRFIGGRWGLLVNRSARVTLRGGRFAGLQNGGIVMTHVRDAVIGDARISGLGNAGVLIHGASTGVVVIRNEISANLGSSNWSAGVVVSDRSADIASDPFSLLQADHYWVNEERIDSRLNGPRMTVIAFNHIALNAASGIYSDGGVQSVIVQNRIEGNSKEGICLDNGSTANVVSMNLIRLNGKRWGKTDAQLRLDFVDNAGRLPDGTSAAKTPGISLDNALYNTIYANQIDHNFGGGVKMVRTAFFNVVGLNAIIDNNEGASSNFHFFGIELGAASADAPATDLDFTPSRGNLVFANGVQGSHYAGIFYAAGSTVNDTFDNSIFGSAMWAMEQVDAQPNSSLNNLTNLPSRNIESGLDAQLLKIGSQPVNK